MSLFNPKSVKKINLPSTYTILCDMDGTLIDTNYANYLSYKYAIEMVTQQKSKIQFHAKNRFNQMSLKKRIPHLTDTQYNQIIALKIDCYNKYLPKTKVNTILVDFIRNHSGINEAVLVTCAKKKRAVETLMYHNLHRYFSRLICWESLAHSKLSNKYINALNLLNINPINSIVFEDNMIEINNAQFAGIPKENINKIEYQGAV